MVITANPPKFDKRQPSKGGYDVIVYIDGSQIIAEDSNGRKIASGVAGTDDALFISSAIVGHEEILLNGSFVFGNTVAITERKSITHMNGVISYASGFVGPAFSVSGQIIRDELLSVNGVIADETITLVSSTDILPDDLLLIYDDTIFNSLYSADGKTGEVQRVESVSGNIVTISERLVQGYATASNAKARIIRPIKVVFQGLRIIGASATDKLVVGITLTYAIDTQFVNCNLRNFGQRAIGIITCYNTLVDSTVISKCNGSGYGHGVLVGYGSAITRVSNSHISNCRHCITGEGRGASTPGQIRSVILTDSTFIGSGVSATIDAHPMCLSFYIYNCEIVSKSAQYAVNVGSKCLVVEDNDIVNGAVSVRDPMVVDLCYISGNVVIGGGVGACFSEDGPNVTINTLIITDNIVRDGGFLIFTNIAPTNFVLARNVATITGDSVSAISLYNFTSGFISDNTITEAGRSGLFLTDCSNMVIYRNNFLQSNRRNTAYFGIDLLNCQYCTFDDNRVIDTTPYQDRCIRETGTCDYNKYSGGVISGYTVGATFFVGTHNTYKNIVGYPTDSSGSSTGTGSEQTIAHGLAAIPVGCKAWIKYSIGGGRYMTQEIPFDATNVYPKHTTGAAYEWRIE